MSEYLAGRIKSLYPDIEISEDVTNKTEIELSCEKHGIYVKTVHQILYKNPNCPICTKEKWKKKLSDIGKLR